MKIKLGFVTNSSSTSYLVFIPDKFDIGQFLHLVDEELKENIAEQCREYESAYVIYEGHMEHIFGQFRESGVLSVYGQTLEYYAIVQIFSLLDLIVHSWDDSADAGLIMDLNKEEIRKDIERIMNGGWGIKYGGWGSTSGEKKI